MKKFSKPIIGLMMLASIFTTLTPAIGAKASANESIVYSTQRATMYGWVTTHDGVGVNLRASQSTSSTILAKIPEGTKVTITSVLSNWYKVTYNGQTGYIARGYLVDEYGDSI